jgi:hypothetical protein
MDINREEVIQRLGGAPVVERMSHEARADALEDIMKERLEAAVAARQKIKGPTVAEHENRVDTRGYRRGVGKLFIHERSSKKPNDDTTVCTVPRLPPMPQKPTLTDFFAYRFAPAAHLLQSAALAKRNGSSEEIIMACLLHDLGGYLMKAEHGYWGNQLIEPYVSEKIAFAVRYHQALRFFPDPSVNYEYPVAYYQTFGVDYVPPPYIVADYEYARNHRWYMESRLVTMNDLYSFDPNVVVSLDDFRDIIGRHFRQPAEGLGFDNTSVSHMWRTMIRPDAPL